jgi:hypothetical protein
LAAGQRKHFRTAERLVGVGVRCWLAGYETCDINCWEAGWHIYADKLGAEKAKNVVAELACWVRALSTAASRRIEYYPFYHPLECLEFCEDECIAISMIAAGQHDVQSVLKSGACSLIGSLDSEEVERTARTFAHVLDDAGIRLGNRLLDDSKGAASRRPAVLRNQHLPPAVAGRNRGL